MRAEEINPGGGGIGEAFIFVRSGVYIGGYGAFGGQGRVNRELEMFYLKRHDFEEIISVLGISWACAPGNGRSSKNLI